MAPREQEWKELYEQLVTALVSFGKNDAFGNGDCWLVDDDWGKAQHKIEITNPEFWSDAVHRRIRQVLASSFPGWGVLVVFGGKAKGSRGFIVYADRVEFESS